MWTEDDHIISGPEFPVPIPECSLAENLIQRMRSQPRENIIHVDAETGISETIGKFLGISLGIAEGLVNIGLEENDVVALVTKDRREFYAALLGIIWAGGTASPIGPRTIHEMKHIFKIIRPRYVFSEVDSLENITNVLGFLKMKAKIILMDAKTDGETTYCTFETLIKEVDIESYNARPVKFPSKQLSLILMSSGTTGLPKGIGLTHRNVLFLLATREYIFSGQQLQEMPFLVSAPSIWITTIAALFLSLATGMPRIFLKDPTFESVLKAIDEFKPVWCIIAPSNLTCITHHPKFKKFDVSSVQLIMAGGSAISKHLINEVKQKWNNNIVVQQIYGMTELGGTVAAANPAVNILSVGKLLPGIQLKILDLKTKKSLGANEVGEICIKSDGTMRGYVGNPKATQEIIDNDGWLHTGDLGYRDGDEYLYIVDRIKEIIKYKNCLVSATELENLIQVIPDVLDAGVVGIPNEEDLQHPMALVVKKIGSTLSEDDIIRTVKENLSDWKHLRGGVKFVDSIPRTPTGKIRRRQLKGLAASLL